MVRKEVLVSLHKLQDKGKVNTKNSNKTKTTIVFKKANDF